VTTHEAYDDPGTPEEISRRTFMVGATVVLGGIVGLGVAIPVVASLVPTEDVIAGAKARSWWPLDAIEYAQLQKSTDTPIKVTFTHHVIDGYIEGDQPDYVWGIKLTPPAMQRLQSSRPEFANLMVNAQGIAPYPVVTMGFVMFSSICPHLGCKFLWDGDQNKFACPCHGSQYTKYGEHIAGPAPRGLDPLPFQEKSGEAQITWVRYKQGVPDRVVVSFS
jgi:Rieske Fe-S protein